MPDTRVCTANLAHAEDAELPVTPEFWQPADTTKCRACFSERRKQLRSARGRKFGVEIEFTHADREEVVSQMERRGLRCQIDYIHTPQRTYWKLVNDGSVSDNAGYAGRELVSPPLRGKAGMRKLELACEALEAAGAQVNRSCGFHVHHEVNDLDAPAIMRAVKNWHACQEAINGMVASNRATNAYTRPLRGSEVQYLERYATTLDSFRRGAACIDRYRAFNVNAYPKHGTLEIRQHHGTLDYEEMREWIEFGQALFEAAKRGENLQADSAQDLVRALGHHGLKHTARARLATRAEPRSARRRLTGPQARRRRAAPVLDPNLATADTLVTAGTTGMTFTVVGDTFTLVEG